MEYNQGNGPMLNLDKVSQNPPGIYSALLELLDGIYQEIVELDLASETVLVLRNCENPAQVGNSYPFVQEADLFCSRKIMLEDTSTAKKLLSLEELRSFACTDEKFKSVQLRVCAQKFVYEWVEVSIFPLADRQGKKEKILITVRNINDHKLMKSIVDNFVYATCDYFIYLDTQADSYVMFSGSTNGTPLPPAVCTNYSDEIIAYARAFVVLEDQDYVIEQMRLDLIQRMLDEHGEHVFYCGVLDPIKGYTRKCLKYVYYDKENKMALLIRTDVTGVYVLEEQKNAQLRLALLEARTDSLTGIYNRNAIETLIRESIQGRSTASSGAFFFIDIDNFKQVNDTLGHGQGDFILQFFSKKLKILAPLHSITGRLGGDEFIVFCPQMDIDKDMEPFAQQLCCAFDDICDSGTDKIGISCSVGISLFPQHGTTYDELYRHADQALYVSKNPKRQYTVFSN